MVQRVNSRTQLWQPGVHGFRSWVQTYVPLIKPRCDGAPPGGRWAQMLAQGQSCSKRGGLAADVTSGLIFLKKKKKLSSTWQALYYAVINSVCTIHTV